MATSITIPIQTTYAIDADKEIEEAYKALDERTLKARAIEDAEGDGISEGNDKIPTESHTESEIKNAYDQTCKKFTDSLKGAIQDFKTLAEEQHQIRLKHDITEDDIKFKLDGEYRGIATVDEEANSIAKEFVSASIDLRKFRSRHERELVAKYPKHKLWPISILFVLFAIEATINGIVFKDLSGGLIGGILVAAGFAAMNVLLAFMTGHFGWKNLIFRDIVDKTREYLRKTLGFIITIIGMSLGLLWNLAVAHYREVATDNKVEDLLNTGQVAFKHLLDNPFGITELEALALLLFGIIVFILVAKDFYNGMDDPFPKYGETTRRQEDAESTWIEYKKYKEELVSDMGEELKQEYQNKIEKNKAILNDFKKTLDWLKIHKDDMLRALTASMKEANRKLAIYRDEYTTIVGRNGRRKHFNIEMTIDDEFNKIYRETQSEESVDKLEQIVEKNIAIYENAIKYIDKLIPTYIEKLHQRKEDGDKKDGFFEKLLKINNKTFTPDSENE